MSSSKKLFKHCVPDHIVAYLNEQKVNTFTKAAMLAEEVFLTCKSAFTMPSTHGIVVNLQKSSGVRTSASATAWFSSWEGRKCFFLFIRAC